MSMMKKTLKQITVWALLFALILTQGYCVNAKKETVQNARYGSVISAGNIVCVGTNKGIYSINKKTGKKIKLTKKKLAGYNSDGGDLDMLLYRNKLYFVSGKYMYCVSVKGGECKKLWKDKNICFVKDGRFYYFDHGICSMKPDGSDIQNHYELQAEDGDVMYYKNRIYYYYNIEGEDGQQQSECASLNQNFTGKKKCKNYMKVLEGSRDFEYSASAVYTHKTYYFSGDNKYQTIECYKGKKSVQIYQTKCKYVFPVGAADGIILVKEGNKKDRFWNIKGGNYRVLTTSGKTLAVIK